MLNKTNTLIQEFREKFGTKFFTVEDGWNQEDIKKGIEQFLIKAIDQTAKEAREHLWQELRKRGSEGQMMGSNKTLITVFEEDYDKIGEELSQKNK